MTRYVILRELKAANEGVTGFGEVGRVDAGSSDGALRKYHGDGAKPDGRYVATPERSWKPVMVTTETKPQLKLEPAPKA